MSTAAERLTGTNYKVLMPPSGKADRIFFDEDIKALGLRVFKSGVGKWIVQYRPASSAGFKANVPPKRVVVGDRSRMSLSEARRAARSVLARVDAGEDPAKERNARSLEVASLVKNVLDQYEQNCRDRQLVNSKTVMSTLRRNLRDRLNERLSDIRLNDLLGIMQAVEKRSGPGAAQDFRSRSSALFAYAVSVGLAPGNPWAGYRKPRATRAELVEVRQTGRVLDDSELARVRDAATKRQDSFGRVVLFLLLSGCRRGEGASLRWEWVCGDEIVFPAASLKQGRTHLVPISSAVAELLSVTPNRGVLCWPTERRLGGATPISGWSQLTQQLLEQSGVEHFTLHDLRRTFRTWAEERFGASTVLSEAAIGHVNTDTLARVYSRPQWKGELRALFQRWGEFVTAACA